MVKRTTLQVNFTTTEKLKKLKIHPNQSYDELINIMIKKLNQMEIQKA